MFQVMSLSVPFRLHANCRLEMQHRELGAVVLLIVRAVVKRPAAA